MIAVIFEVWPQPDRQSAYLEAAAVLRPLLEEIDGFLSIERFASLADPQKLLSLSFWRDEQAVAQWRNLEAHRRIQSIGRDHMLADYHLRVAVVSRDYGMHERAEAPPDSRCAHDAPHRQNSRASEMASVDLP